MRVHFIGIGGISMSALAMISLEAGFIVTGSDISDSHIVQKLIDRGINVKIGHNAKNADGADLIVYTAAVKNDNPEIVFAKENNIPLIDRADYLGKLMKQYNYGIAISGSHGKTTTTSMTSLIFNDAKLDPTILIGGELDAIGGNVKTGKSQYFITEACEYVESFLKFYPFVGVILNIEEDHLDYFKDINHIIQSFKKFAALIPENGFLFLNADNDNTMKIKESANCNIITFALKANANYKAYDISFDKLGHPSFDVLYKDLHLGRFSINTPGEHNVYNALASIAIAHNAGIDISTIQKSLGSFSGTHRRFDIKGTKKNITVIDDYAHHPTEVKAFLKATRNYPHNRIWCIFQPHTYSRTKTLLSDFAKAFMDADKVIITEIYAAREKDTGEISSIDLVNNINKYSKNAIYKKDFSDIAEFIKNEAKDGDLVLTVGAGTITDLGDMILEKL